jgi:hypothetical protein
LNCNRHSECPGICNHIENCLPTTSFHSASGLAGPH